MSKKKHPKKTREGLVTHISKNIKSQEPVTIGAMQGKFHATCNDQKPIFQKKITFIILEQIPEGFEFFFIKTSEISETISQNESEYRRHMKKKCEWHMV